MDPAPTPADMDQFEMDLHNESFLRAHPPKYSIDIVDGYRTILFENAEEALKWFDLWWIEYRIKMNEIKAL